MKFFRITREKYATDLSGEGARLYGGRWNSKGIALLYTSEHASLAALEVLVHFPIRMLPSDLTLVELHSEDPVVSEIIVPGEISSDWKSYPAPNSLAERGDLWIKNLSSLLLKVPSVLIPGEYNILVNPQHTDFKKMSINNMTPFHFDERLIR